MIVVAALETTMESLDRDHNGLMRAGSLKSKLATIVHPEDVQFATETFNRRSDK